MAKKKPKRAAPKKAKRAAPKKSTGVSPKKPRTVARKSKTGASKSKKAVSHGARRPQAGASSAVAMVEVAWEQLEAWCRANVPGLVDVLNPGASEKEIATLERHIKQPLPADLRASLAIHNGQAERPLGAYFLFGLPLLTIEAIKEAWDLWQEMTCYNDEYREDMTSFPAGAIQLDYANPGWVPLTKFCGNHLGADLSPGPAGSVGQIINFGRDERKKSVLAASWGEFLLSYAKFLASDGFRVIDSDPGSWGVNFEPVFKCVRDYVESSQHPHDALVDWRKTGRWPIR